MGKQSERKRDDFFSCFHFGIFHFFTDYRAYRQCPETRENLSGREVLIFPRGVFFRASAGKFLPPSARPPFPFHRRGAPGPREVDHIEATCVVCGLAHVPLVEPFTSVGIPPASPRPTSSFARHRPFFPSPSSSSSHAGGCASPQHTLSRSTCSAPLAACAGGAMESIDSSGSSGSGPGALCVHMYVFAGVTASVSRNIP